MKFRDIEGAYEFVSFGSPFEHNAWVSHETGKVYYQSDHRFKCFLVDREMLEAWHEYENRRTQQALRERCRDNDIPLED